MRAGTSEIQAFPRQASTPLQITAFRPRRPTVDWEQVQYVLAAFGEGAGDAVMLVLAVAPAAAGFALLLGAFGLIAV
jgi:hypothetical protein